jgi:hypothetical protein
MSPISVPKAIAARLMTVPSSVGITFEELSMFAVIGLRLPYSSVD